MRNYYSTVNAFHCELVQETFAILLFQAFIQSFESFERRNNFKRLLFTWPSLSLFDHFLGLGGTYLHTQCRASNSCQGTMFPLFRKIAHRPASVENFEKLISNPIGTETNDKKKIRGWDASRRRKLVEHG